ncbi:MAG: hypothetical protein QM737_10515 [Ferruginibacter sp.]
MQKLAILILLFISFDLRAQKNLTEGAKLLFQNTKTKITPTEKNDIYKKSNLCLSNDKKQFAIGGDVASLDHPFNAIVLPTDMNKDGKEEIFIIFGNSYTSGSTGTNVLLFIKDKAGVYQFNFGFSGTTPDIIPIKTPAYPDLLIGGPGIEFPIWRWNGKEYVFSKKITEKQLTKIKTISVATASKDYVNNLKFPAGASHE